MADLQTAQSVLRGLRCDVNQTTNDYYVVIRNQKYLITNADIDEYNAIKCSIHREIETQIFYPGKYEHAIQHEGRRLFPRETISMESRDGITKIEISFASPLFILFLTDVDDLNRELRPLNYNSFSREELTPLNELFRIRTLKVLTSAETSLGRSVQKMHELAEAAAFHVAYGRGIAISFTKTWERTFYWIGRRRREEVQFPLLTYNTELVSYYNLAISSDSLILSYLALYQIVEYFYTSVSEDDLHKKVREQLIAPDFSHTKSKKLRNIIKIVRKFDTRHNELSSLNLVLSTFFEKPDIQAWIEAYEQANGRYFTQLATIFGVSMAVDVNDGAIIASVASRIYHIRNALVHNKEGELSRFIPYTGQEEALVKEAQLLAFLAESLIIKTRKDI